VESPPTLKEQSRATKKESALIGKLGTEISIKEGYRHARATSSIVRSL
jgi:hypothetical protein